MPFFFEGTHTLVTTVNEMPIYSKNQKILKGLQWELIEKRV
jgi:hypothetical protein